ncbi:MAG: S9 family peptidase [Planctomycetota bacterium]
MTIWHPLTLAALLTWSPTVAMAQDDRPDVTPSLEEIFELPPLHGVRPSRAQIAADGSWVLYRWRETETEDHERDLWVVTPNDPSPRLLLQGDWKPAEKDKPRQREGWRGGVSVAPTGNAAIITHDGWLHRFTYDDGPRLEPLFDVGDGRASLEWDESGQVVWIQQGSRTLWRLDLESGERTEIASELPEEARIRDLHVDHGFLIFSIPETEKKPEAEQKEGVDFEVKTVNTLTSGKETKKVPIEKPEAGLYVFRLATKSFTKIPDVKDNERVSPSADGKHFLIRNVERENDRRLIMADYLTEQVTAVPVRGDIAGDPAPKVALELTSIDGERRTVQLDQAERFFLRQTDWSEEGSRCLIERVSDDWHVRELFVFDAATNGLKRIFAEYDDAWVQGPASIARWSKDREHVLFTSEQTGWNQLYRADPASGEVTALTDGEFEVTWMQELDDGRIFFASNEADPAEQHLSLIQGPGQWKTLPTPRGFNDSFEIAAEGSVAVFEHADLGVPEELYSIELNGAGKPVRLTETIPESWTRQGFTAPEIVEFQNPQDEVTVRALLYKPSGFDPSRRYPAVVFIHGAGYLQNVTRNLTRYAVNMSFHQRLANKGYVVLDPDYRHSKGYGRDFRTDIHGFMGGKDLEDVVAGVEYLGNLGWVDTERVGIYGGSYGGFMTLMALFTSPDTFACGAALRSVTDWRTYNSWYTNPRLGDPKEDAENYRLSSPIDHAEGLTQPLLILHGLKDSNVFAQDSIRLIEKLINLRKDFEAMLYPSQNHGFDDPDAWIDEYKRIERFFDRHLQPNLSPAGD